MIIIKDKNLTIPRGISPSFTTNSGDVSLQDKSVTVEKNGVATITADSGFDGLSSVKLTTNVIPNLEQKVVQYVKNGQYSVKPGTTYDGIGNVSITVDVPIPEYKSQEKTNTYTENGDYTITPDSSYDGLSKISISVNVPEREIKYQDKSVTYTKNGNYNIWYDADYDALGWVDVSVNVPEKKLQQALTLNITKNGFSSYVPSSGYDGVANIVAITDVKPNLQDKTISSYEIISGTPGETLTVSYDTSYDGINSVTIPKVAIEQEAKIVDPNDTEQLINPSEGYVGMSNVIVNPVIPNLQFKTITSDEVISDFPEQVLVVNIDEGYDGLSGVEIKKVSIQGDAGVHPSIEPQTITPSDGYSGIAVVSVEPVTADIDSNITGENIKKGVEILGVTGEYAPVTRSLVITPTTETQTKTPGTGVDGFDSVTVNAVTSSIDSNITAENIKKGVNILGVTGTYDASTSVNLQSKELTLYDLETFDNPSSTPVNVTPDEGYDGLSSVSVPKFNLESLNYTFTSPKGGVIRPSENYDALSNVYYSLKQEQITIDPTLSYQEFTPDDGYAGFSKVKVNAAFLQQNVMLTYQYIITNTVPGYHQTNTVKPEGDYIGFDELNVDMIAIKDKLDITPSTEAQTYSYEGGYHDFFGVKNINVNAVTSSIDSNIKPENIKKGITILGVTGTYEGS